MDERKRRKHEEHSIVLFLENGEIVKIDLDVLFLHQRNLCFIFGKLGEICAECSFLIGISERNPNLSCS